MTKISCLIVDDEHPALDLLEEYIKQTPFLQLRHRCSSAIEALEILETENINVIFLDIQMPGLTGLQLSKVVDKTTKVIFTTAFDHYALEGFKVSAIDYLLKPFNYEEFYKAAEKAKAWFTLTGSNQTNKDNNYIFVKADYQQIKVDLNHVLYFEGQKDYVKIVLDNSTKPILTLISMKLLESQLPPDKFMRVHRSYIVALDKIHSIQRGQIIIRDIRITVAEPYKSDFNDFLSGNSINVE